MHPYNMETVRAVGKITAKGQTTVPQEVRSLLNVAPGDLIVWESESDGSFRVRRVQFMDVDYLRAVEATLSEWASPEDEEAYSGL